MKAQVIEAPALTRMRYYKSLFLGGGITNCVDWQKEVIKELSDLEMTLINPRRAHFDLTDPTASAVQIEWEYRFLRGCNQIMFWFSPETLCPITLFELGSALERFDLEMKENRHQDLFIGCHPEYKRILDVQHQARLKGVGVFTDLNKLINAIKTFNQ